MKKKVWIWVLVVLCVSCTGAGIAWYMYQHEKEEKSLDTEQEPAYTGSEYEAEDQLKKASDKLLNNPEKAAVIKDITTVEKQIAVAFEGMADTDTMNSILDILDENGIKATFFPTAIEAREDEETIQNILKAGHDVENGTLSGTKHMEELGQDEILNDFCRSQEVFLSVLSQYPTVLKCNATDYTQDILTDADAAGLKSVVVCKNYLNYSSFQDEETAENYVKRLKKGSIISIKLEGALDEIEYEPSRKEDKPAVDKQPGIKSTEESEEKSEQSRLLDVVAWFTEAISKLDYQTVPVKEFPQSDAGDMTIYYEELKVENAGDLASIVEQVHTTDRKVGFVFRGLGDETVLNHVLDALDEIGAQATFFVTGKEVDNYSDQIKMIQKRGHEIANGGYSGTRMDEEDFDTVCEDIYMGEESLKLLGIETGYYMPAYGAMSETIQEAAAAMDVRLISHTSSPAKAKYEEAGKTADQMVSLVYKSDRPALCRGDIVYMSMTTFKDKTLLADLVRSIYKKRIVNTKYGSSMLAAVTLSGLMENTWSYPASTKATGSMIAQSGKAAAPVLSMLTTNYIGNPDAILEGFAAGETSGVNTEGKLNTGQNTLFLTFDDWGSEVSIGKLLHVLKAWGVKATFFVKTQYILDSRTENLLRAIAADGHDIASHTNTHMKINITDDMIPALQADLVKSNQVLARVTGNTGHLTAFFRPPTLAVSKAGMTTTFDCGYRYVINGDFSTADYECKSADEFLDRMVNGITLNDGSKRQKGAGSIIVMHMSDTAAYTASGLDKFFSYNASLPDGDPNKYVFSRLSDYLK